MERAIILKNRQNRFLTVTLQEYKKGDEEGMIACIRDEYGGTYFKTGFYQPKYIQKEAETGQITFLTARTKAGEIAGMMILKQFYPEESMCEIASQIFRKKYRGYGLAMPFFQFGLDILQSRHYSAAYCLPVMFHDVTQRLLFRLGFRATGFILNVFDLDTITHSYRNGRNTKHSQGIQIMAQEKRDAGMLFLPEEHKTFCCRIYDRLNAAYRMGDSVSQKEIAEKETAEKEIAEKETAKKAIPRKAIPRKVIPWKSEISYENNAIQSSLEIRIYQVGEDLKSRILQIQEKHPLKGKQTAGIFLNCNDPNAVWAYRKLRNMGYFFTGLKPLCSEREYLVLHNPGEVEIRFEDYVLSEEFAELGNYIRKCWKKRNLEKKNLEKRNKEAPGGSEKEKNRN